MAPNCIGPDRQRSGERGSIIIMTAIFMLLLFLMVGLCIDVSRIYMVRAELQNAADAAALAAARELNSGTGGIDNAVTRASFVTNTVDFARLGIGIAQVRFAKFPTVLIWTPGQQRKMRTLPTLPMCAWKPDRQTRLFSLA